jgi:hypothetical protein
MDIPEAEQTSTVNIAPDLEPSDNFSNYNLVKSTDE